MPNKNQAMKVDWNQALMYSLQAAQIAQGVLVMVKKLDVGTAPYIDQTFTIKGYKVSVTVARAEKAVAKAGKRGG